LTQPADERSRSRVGSAASIARNTTKIAFFPQNGPDRPPKWVVISDAYIENTLLGGSMEFFERINELGCCNNRITMEFLRDAEVLDIQQFEPK
jgi:hypothetical protein